MRKEGSRSGSSAFPVTEVVTHHKLAGQSGYSASDTKYDGYGDIYYTAQYDVGGSSPVSTKTITYGTCTSNCGTSSPGIAAYIPNLPGEIVTTQNGSVVAQSNMAYGSNGALTQTWVWNGSAFLSQTNANTYNANGTPATTYDLNNNETTYTYATGSYSDGCNGVYPFPTSITNSGTALTQSLTYDCEGGVPLTSSDPNGNVTTYTYSSGGTGEPYWRTFGIEDPLTNTETFIYPNAHTSDDSSVTVPITSSTTDTTHVKVDGYGRLINTQVNQELPLGIHYDTVSRGYLWETSGTYINYFQVSTSQPCSVATGGLCTMAHFSYIDPLGRTYLSNTTSNEIVTNTFTPTGTTYYVLSTLTSAPTGENAKQTQTQYDGLGRVKSICHIGTTTSTGSGTSCPSGSYNGAVDTYTYGQGTGYTTVSVTRGSQTRTNTYDALGRLTKQVTPEGGTWNFAYDTTTCGAGATSYGNLLCTTDPNGNWIIPNYDSLNRVTSISAGAGGFTTCKRFRYDNASGVLGSLPTGVSLTNQYGRMVEAENG